MGHPSHINSTMAGQLVTDVITAAFESAEQPTFQAAAAAELERAKVVWQAGAPGGVKPFFPYDAVGNPYGAAVTCGLIYPVTGQDPDQNWSDTSVPTVSLLHRSGLLEMIPAGRVLPVDYHNHAHASGSTDDSRPAPQSNIWPGDSAATVDWLADQALNIDEWRMRNLENSATIFMGRMLPD